MEKARIITRFPLHGEPAGWQQQLAAAISDPAELLRLLGLPEDILPGSLRANTLFRLQVTHSYLRRMQKADPQDPLLLQVLPQLAETAPQPEHFSADPVGDLAASPAPGVIHKYHGRVLLVTTGACAIHCRYCFRRAFPYSEATASRDQWRAALDYIAADESIDEIILSGGDPLVLSDDKLADLYQRLAAIPHLQRLRLHTRLPVVLPDRITPAFLDLAAGTRLSNIVVIHCNHPNEINAEVTAAIDKLRAANIPVFNQAVLLKNINNNVDVLTRLSHALFSSGVTPYYLHQLDAVAGAAHFAVSTKKAQALYAQLSARLPGYLLPRLVTEQPGRPAKTLLSPA